MAAAASEQAETCVLKRTASEIEGPKDSAAPDAKRQRLAQWLREAPSAVRSA
eukprot:CAMPEP_0175596210 /NCGR_PEP_ID=MMETSP0096-20121207/55373_1 /TAXON_ID=311494 /ORGANISM="Alexandrium monilatum, Strain CCMP3105" /LENGTH=51 /DNA_ID=CAMNT_0016900583 /DNA_START=1 /DNA_END=152 /DNA_ORIENTATION=+